LVVVAVAVDALAWEAESAAGVSPGKGAKMPDNYEPYPDTRPRCPQTGMFIPWDGEDHRPWSGEDEEDEYDEVNPADDDDGDEYEEEEYEEDFEYDDE
jgi:hypothetical protein